MKAIIITYNDAYDYETRTKYVCEYLKQKGYDVEFLISDFNHRTKQKYIVNRENVKYIHVPKYSKNLSIGRIISCIVFAKKATKYLMKENFELIYHCAPPNITIKELIKLKRKKEFFMITEIGDMWPETLPIPQKIKKIFRLPLSIWSNFRNKYLKYSDGVIYECDLFKNLLEQYKKGQTIYLCKKDFFNNDFKIIKSNDEFLNFVYIGSINNIFDIDLVVNFLVKIKERKNTKFYIIGDGEYKSLLINLCEKNYINYQYCGIIYDNNEKYEILKKCQFAFNIMKNTVTVGATMKSLEYFHWGMAVINNISADTEKIIEKYNCGVNITSDNNDLQKKIDTILNLSNEDIEKMQLNSRRVYEEFFSEQIMKQKYLNFFDSIERCKNEENTNF